MKLNPRWVMVIALASVASISSAQDKKPKTAPAKSEAPAPNAPQKLSTQEIFSKGFQALQNNDPATAADLFRTGLESNPNDGNAWLYLYKAQMRLGDASGSENSKAKALALGVPSTAFEPVKAAKISLPSLPVASFNVVDLPEAVRKKLEEDPAYRLPSPSGETDANAQPYFMSAFDGKVIMAIGSLIYVARYISSYEALIDIEISGDLFSRKIGSQFGIKTKTMQVFPPRNSYPSSYSREDRTILCESVRLISEIKSGTVLGGTRLSSTISDGVAYKCSDTNGSTPLMKTLDAANASPIENHISPKPEYMAYFPSKRLLIRFIKENEINSFP